MPFENLDIVAGREMPIDVGAHYEKVVDDRRGGFCYKSNGLFDWLLRELGFSTRLVEAQVKGEDRFSHAAVLVDLCAPGPPESRDGWYLADVRFGDFAHQPLPLTGEPRSVVSGTYRVRALDDGRFVNQYEAPRPGEEDTDFEPGQWITRYRLTPRGRNEIEFESVCEWTHTTPDSGFTGRLICSLATEAGRRTLSENTLTITTVLTRKSLTCDR